MHKIFLIHLLIFLIKNEKKKHKIEDKFTFKFEIITNFKNFE
jgi:hypothetical protein